MGAPEAAKYLGVVLRTLYYSSPLLPSESTSSVSGPVAGMTTSGGNEKEKAAKPSDARPGWLLNRAPKARRRHRNGLTGTTTRTRNTALRKVVDALDC